MKTETYKGRKLKTVKGKEFGYVQHSVNGVSQGRHMGDEDSALKWMRGTIDHADEVGVSSGRYGAEWYAPGTFELCEHGHAKEIGGECAHHYCVVQRPAPTAEPAPVADQATTNRSVDAYLSREYPGLFPDVEDEDADTVTASHAYHARTGRPYPNTPPADGLATVNAWAHRQQSGVWTVDGTTVAVRTDDRGHIRGSVIVLETIGSKLPGS